MQKIQIYTYIHFWNIANYLLSITLGIPNTHLDWLKKVISIQNHIQNNFIAQIITKMKWTHYLAKLWTCLDTTGYVHWINVLLLWMPNHTYFNPIQDGHFQGCSRMGGGAEKPLLPKICHAYPKMMKLDSYTLPIDHPKNMSITWHTPWVLLTSAIFHWKSANFVISRNTDIDFILIHNF